MKWTSAKLALVIVTFAAQMHVASHEIQAEVRRGFLYDLLHIGKGCGPGDGASPVLCAHWSIDAELEAEKARMREEMRVHRLQFYLHNQDHKSLLHPECAPIHECYWGIYPTCWRRFPGKQYCPDPGPGIYDSCPYDHVPYEMGQPPIPPEFETVPGDGAQSQPPVLVPPAPQPPPSAEQAPAPTESEEPLYFE